MPATIRPVLVALTLALAACGARNGENSTQDANARGASTITLAPAGKEHPGEAVLQPVDGGGVVVSVRVTDGLDRRLDAEIDDALCGAGGKRLYGLDPVVAGQSRTELRQAGLERLQGKTSINVRDRGRPMYCGDVRKSSPLTK